MLGRGLPVVPIRAGKDPYGLMGKLQAAPFKEEALGDVAETVFTVLNNKSQTAQFLAPGMVQAFIESTSFATSKKRMGIVERLPTIAPELRQMLRDVTGDESSNRRLVWYPRSFKHSLKES